MDPKRQRNLLVWADHGFKTDVALAKARCAVIKELVLVYSIYVPDQKNNGSDIARMDSHIFSWIVKLFPPFVESLDELEDNDSLPLWAALGCILELTVRLRRTTLLEDYIQQFCTPRGSKVKPIVFQVAVAFHCIKYVGRRLKDDPELIRPPNGYILPLTLALKAVHEFSFHKSLGLIRLPLENGADPNEFRHDINPCQYFFAKYYDDWELLKNLERNRIEIIKLLVQYNADFMGTLDVVGFIGKSNSFDIPGRVLLCVKEKLYFYTMTAKAVRYCKPVDYIERRYSIPLMSLAHSMSGLFSEELARGEFESFEVINERVIDELIEQLNLWHVWWRALPLVALFWLG